MGMIFQLYNYRDAIIDIAWMISIVNFNGILVTVNISMIHHDTSV